MKKVVAVIGAVLGLLLLCPGVLTLLNNGRTAISIIGGADGPTSIFLAGKVGGNFGGDLTIIGTAMLVISVLFLIGMRQHK